MTQEKFKTETQMQGGGKAEAVIIICSLDLLNYQMSEAGKMKLTLLS